MTHYDPLSLVNNDSVACWEQKHCRSLELSAEKARTIIINPEERPYTFGRRALLVLPTVFVIYPKQIGGNYY